MIQTNSVVSYFAYVSMSRFKRMKDWPIILIDDDVDDKQLIEDILRDLSSTHPLIWFGTARKALDYFATSNELPLVVICDINMPEMNGIALKKRVDSDPALQNKMSPFVFYTTAITRRIIEESNKCPMQGLFEKSEDYEVMKKEVDTIIKYWELFQEHTQRKLKSPPGHES